MSHAVKYSEYFGLAVLPLSSSKRPPNNYSWQPLQKRRMTVKEILGCSVLENIGIVTGAISGIAVVDCDTPEAVDRFRNERKTPVVVKTPRGVHFYYRHPGEHVKTCKGVGFDIRGDGGYVVAPPSVVDGKQYEFQTGSEELKPVNLPLFDLNWVPKPKTETGSTEFDNKIRNGAAYIKTIHATQGNGGDKATFVAACYLKDSGMDQMEAWLAMLDWNQTNAKPPWNDKDLLHKLKSAYERN